MRKDQVDLANAVVRIPESKSAKWCSRGASDGDRRIGIPAVRLSFTHATRLSGRGVADEWVTQLLRQGDSTVFKNIPR
jgi:hypothetical protein